MLTHTPTATASSARRAALRVTTHLTTRFLTTSPALSAQPLNRYSQNITQPKAQGASQVSTTHNTRLTLGNALRHRRHRNRCRSKQTHGWSRKRMVSLTADCPHLRYEGNPCNRHILALGQRIKKSLVNSGIVGYQFGTVGVSDGISMGTRGSKSPPHTLH